MFIERDPNGRYEECLQCGWHRELESIVPINAMAGASTQSHLDNLSQEIKKIFAERREQGLHCGGTLPFGAMKGENGTPVPDIRERKANTNGQEVSVRNYDGLKIAFELSAQRKSDMDVAISLNTLGYSTTGTHGSRPFSKETVRYVLKNRFYIGYIPNGNGGWLKARHAPFIEPQLFEVVQKLRTWRVASRAIIRSDTSVYSHLAPPAVCYQIKLLINLYWAVGVLRLRARSLFTNGVGNLAA